LGAEFAEELPGEGAGGDARSGFAGGSALEYVAGVVKIEFLGAS
jgi:hypothetical protein